MMLNSSSTAMSAPTLRILSFPPNSKQPTLILNPNSLKQRRMRISAKNKGDNRKPLQKGRNLSIEAIQTTQALKRAYQNDPVSLNNVFRTKFNRLLKFDMIQVLRELLRQNYCLLAFKVFEDIIEEEWYKPQLSLYNDMISTMCDNGLLEKVEILVMYLESEQNLEPDVEGFCVLLRTFMSFKLTRHVMKCYELMKGLDCEPNRSTFRMLINGFELMGELDSSELLRQDAKSCYGSLEFLDEEDEEEEKKIVLSKN